MKDLEKIKSEDLGCQVQDANPGNFAIEQEVGAMVGATVPAPTAPSADDARELGAQLLVFLRRALLPIRSALRTALAAIYAHLDSRCTDYTPAAYASYIPRPYDPMGSTPRTLPNLLTAITAFAPRKISNGSAPNDGIPDGISLGRILADTTVPITEIIDNTTGWTMSTSFPSRFPNLNKLVLNCESMVADAITFVNDNYITEAIFPSLKTITHTNCHHTSIVIGSKVKRVYMPELESALFLSNTDSGAFGGAELEEIELPKLTNIQSSWQGAFLAYAPKVKKIVFGAVTSFPSNINFRVNGNVDGSCSPNIIHMEFGDGVAINLGLANWNPTNALSSSASDLVADQTAHPTWKNLDQFLQNFLEHICKKLANRTGQTKLTLTLSAGVYTAIMTDKDIKAELVARNWKVTDGSNNYNN